MLSVRRLGLAGRGRVPSPEWHQPGRQRHHHSIVEFQFRGEQGKGVESHRQSSDPSWLSANQPGIGGHRLWHDHIGCHVAGEAKIFFEGAAYDWLIYKRMEGRKLRQFRLPFFMYP